MEIFKEINKVKYEIILKGLDTLIRIELQLL